MFRNYEDPHKLEAQLEKEMERINRDDYEPDEFDYERIANLQERLNFAWQDDEYDSMFSD